MTEVVLLYIPRKGYAGDRAKSMGAMPKDYFDFEIHARSPGQELDDDTLIEGFEGYDHSACHIIDQKSLCDRAFHKAKKLAKLISGSEQDLIQDYAPTEETARKSAMAKLTKRELRALGLV